MALTAGWRKLSLTAHVTTSVGWLGAVAAFLSLAISGLTSRDAQMTGAAYLAMDSITRFVIVPAAVGSVVTGLIGSLTTPWGLFRHYWVLAKLLVTLASTVLLLLHTQPISYLAEAVAQAPISATELRRVRIQLIVDAGGALVALLTMTALAVYKPRGVTPFGRRKQMARA